MLELQARAAPPPRPQPRNHEASEGAIPDADKILAKLRGDVKTKREHSELVYLFA
jgi:hypothetical protein